MESRSKRNPAGLKSGGFLLARLDPANPGLITPVAITAVLAVVVLVVDHYDRLSEWLIYLSSGLLLGTVALLFGLSVATNRARNIAEKAEAIRAASVEAATFGVITTDVNGVVLDWNEAASLIFGFERSDAVGRDAIEMLVPVDQQEDFRMNLGEIADGSFDQILGRYLEVRLRDSFGRVFPVELSGVFIPTDPPMFTIFTRSLTQHRLREEENSRLADIVRSSEDAVISVDLNGRVTSWNRGADRFYGYTEQQAIGKRLSDLTFPNEGSIELGSLFRRVLNGISGEITAERRTRDGRPLWVTSRAFPIRDIEGNVSGMSLTSRDVTDQHRRAADEERERETSLWRDRVRTALENSGFELWAQPVYRLDSGEVSHHELLIRMKQGNEVLAPGAFLPHVEGSDLMSAIDRWVVEQGAELARSMPVAINLSGRNLSDPDFGEWIADTIARVGSDPKDFRFEITESVAIENLAEARKLVDDLTRIGCLVSLDDFGTGYGSFTYLKHLPVHEIKIDASFVQNLTVDESNRRVVNSLIMAARNFSVTTVAEGIENEADLEAVREMGADLAQGFHLGRPAPVEVRELG